MSRNNEDRFGAHAPGADPNIVPQLVNNSVDSFQGGAADPASAPLSFTVPTEIITLPSGGKHYPEEHPLHGKNEIEIRHMTAKDEDVLNSKALLKKGIAIDRLLQGVIVNKRIKVDSLLVGDKNALIVAARITGYGEDYSTKVSCPACGVASDCDFDLDESLIVNSGENIDDVEAILVESGVFSLTLPRTKFTVEVRLMTGADEKKIIKLAQSKQIHKLPDTPLTDQFRAFIVSVDGNTNRVDINRFIDLMPARDARHLRNVYSKIMPNVELKHNFECDGCGYEQVIDIPFTVDFFWPRR